MTTTAATYQLSPIQDSMLVQSLRSQPDPYFRQFGTRMRGELDVRAFHAAWQHVVNRHDILRTSFVWQRLERPMQVVHSSVSVPFDRYNWTDVLDRDRPWRLQRLFALDRTRGLDLASAPLMRITAIQFAEDDWYVLWTYHHLVLDGWSRPLVLRSVREQYEAVRAGRAHPLQAPELGFQSYVEWVSRQDRSLAERAWRETLLGYRGCPLAWRLPPPQDASDTSDSTVLRIEPDRVAAWTLTASKRRVTLNAVVCAAWALLMSRLVAETDIAFGICISGRSADLSGVDTIVGPLMNVVPLRAKTHPTTRVGDLLRDLQAQIVAAQEYGYLPLTAIQAQSEIPQSRPIIETLVNFQRVRRREDAVDPATRVESYFFEPNGQPLTLHASLGAALTLQLRRQPAVIDAGLANEIMRCLPIVIEAIVADVDRALEDVTMATWTPPVETPVRRLSITSAIMQGLSRHPDRVACVGHAGAVTCRTLRRRVAHCADHLRALGDIAARPVAILASGIDDLAIGLLAVLAAGATAVPLDESWPPSLLDSVLAETLPTAILTVREYESSLDRSNVPVVLLDHIEAAPTHPGASSIHAGASGAAIIVYGSADSRAGVLVTHESLAAAFSPLTERLHSLHEITPSGHALVDRLPALLWGLAAGIPVVDLEISAAPDRSFRFGPPELAFASTADAGVDVAVVQSRGQRMPDGYSGRIYLRGEPLTSGYYQSPELTAVQMVPDPGGHGARMLRTRTFGRRASGAIDVIATDSRWHRRGGRLVNLEEIERTLETFPGATQASCALGGRTEDRLFASVWFDAAAAIPDALAFRRWAMQKLPMEGVPDEFRLATSGEAVAIGADDPESSPEHRDAIEEALASIWASILDVRHIERRMNFFESGGSSLLANALIARTAERLGVEPPLTLVFDSPTFGAFADAIRALQRTSVAAEANIGS